MPPIFILWRKIIPAGASKAFSCTMLNIPGDTKIIGIDSWVNQMLKLPDVHFNWITMLKMESFSRDLESLKINKGIL